MKICLSLLGFIIFTSTSYGDIRNICLDLSRNTLHETVVSVTSSITEENKQNISIPDAAKVLRDAKNPKDAIGAIIHSDDIIPAKDLVVLFEAMSENDIGIAYISIGQCPTGMDKWAHK